VLRIKQAEAKSLLSVFQDPAATTANGLFIGGIKYYVAKADHRSIYSFRSKVGGCIVVKTNKLFIIATYVDARQGGSVVEQVERMADYLLNVNF